VSAVFAVPAFLFGMVFMWSKEVQQALYLMTEVAPNLTVDALIMWILATPMQFYVARSFYIKVVTFSTLF
jgi:Cu+-exporting ATPase